MVKATYQFPEGFLWGTATSAHQVEGGNINNNWHLWENEPGRIVEGQKSGLACDWWGGRWKEDLKNAAASGQNAHRLSIEWSRVQPKPDQWDEDALGYYLEMIGGMLKLGLRPMVTLHHFSDPIWIYDQGCWEWDETVEYFSRFVRRVVEALKDQVDLWVTINEPAVYTTGGYVEGNFPPGKKDLGAAFTVMRNLLKGHAVAYRIIHEIQPKASVGIAKQYRAMEPARKWFLPDVWIHNFLSSSFNDGFSNTILDGTFRFALKSEKIPEAIGTQDYIGVNYYSQDTIIFKPFEFKDVFHRRFFPEGETLSETGFIANRPQGMTAALKWARKFRLPIYITENGVEDGADKMRPEYLVQHLHKVWRAANSSWYVKGYFHWSQVDNFEWERGWTQRFGLWGLDEKTQQRQRRKSADLYAEICRMNAIDSETVRKFAPGAFDLLYPV
jgi:beta-glucosidase